MFDAGETRMIGLPYGEKNYDYMLSRFYLTPERYGQTDRQTDRFAISISRVSMLTRDKNRRDSRSSCTLNERGYEKLAIFDQYLGLFGKW